MSKRLEIVVVDDEIQITELLKTFIECATKNSNVHTFNDSNEARNYLIKNCVDILITDFKMPRYTGIELMEEISPVIKKILISGYVSEIAEERLNQLDAVFFEKPVPMLALEKIIREYEKKLDLDCLRLIEKQHNFELKTSQILIPDAIMIKISGSLIHANSNILRKRFKSLLLDKIKIIIIDISNIEILEEECYKQIEQFYIELTYGDKDISIICSNLFINTIFTCFLQKHKKMENIKIYQKCELLIKYYLNSPK